MISFPGPRDRSFSVLERAISDGQAVLLEGPVGSGKTCLVRHLAEIHGEEVAANLVVIQLFEQMDAKIVFGGYRCSEVPGEFLWEPGPLTKAAVNGNWILLEDVDYAPLDFFGHLVSLVEGRCVHLTGRGSITADKGFQLFVTRRTKENSVGLQSSEEAKDLHLKKFWLKVRLHPFTSSELIRMSGTKFPVLNSCCRRLVEIFSDFVSWTSECSSGTARLLGTRDLMKWCKRISFIEDVVNDPLAIFREASDVLAAFIPSPASRLAELQFLASKLGVAKEQVEFYSQKYKPSVQVASHSLKIGRIETDRVNILEGADSNRRFAITRPAAVLLERVLACLNMREPVLLVGETGCGKTAAVQFLAKYSGRTLHIVNLSQQSETGDLFGGYKPVGLQHLMENLKNDYLELFRKTFSLKKNQKFLEHVHMCCNEKLYEQLLNVMDHTSLCGMKKNLELCDEWSKLLIRIRRFLRIIKKEVDTMAFSFVEGVLLKAIQKGDWILLDEINLASPETLSGLCSLLENSEEQKKVFLEHRADAIEIHQDFRILACMNPATDVGKRNLPPGLRNRFTEVFVEEPTEAEDLTQLTESYLQGMGVEGSLLARLVGFYRNIKERSVGLRSDSWGHSPHYSLRTFCRALDYGSKNMFGNPPRSLFEAFSMSFMTEVDTKSREVVAQLITEFLLGKNPTRISQILSTPCNPPWSGHYRNVEGYWIERGDEVAGASDNYVITPGVRRNLRDLSRILAARRYPVLLQGETSVGKTSLIKHVARLTGNTCIRINNHEHTDLQEYLGSYVSDSEGKLGFVEGPLVQAMRRGHWIILDELNLAPPDILEALNRVLDDNRELFIAETQTVLKAHPRFALLATQNPPGLYGGRKQLSRAFRNRFVELHFSELPQNELEEILQKRCALPPTYARKMVSAMRDLQIYRNSAGMFSGKESYMTLRDLFRWAERYSALKSDACFKDWDQYLADQGYFVLAGRCRREADSVVVKEVLEKHLKRQIDPGFLFGVGSPYLTISTTETLDGFEGIVWTRNLLRMAVLVGQAVRFGEPALLVGDTGCGKTSLCQILALAQKKELVMINCHLMTEAADFLGRLRPESPETASETGVLFSWCEGPLVRAMKRGQPILIDEISLAEDSVLERLNSVLEPERTLVLAEQSSGSEVPIVEASEGFSVLATMNPGGDYGKKELSKALRNRFTEIWCESAYGRADLVSIISKNLTFSRNPETALRTGQMIVDFVSWFLELVSDKLKYYTDMLSWVHFINRSAGNIGLQEAYVQGAHLILLDGLGRNKSLDTAVEKCVLSGFPGSNSSSCDASQRARILQCVRMYLCEQVGRDGTVTAPQNDGLLVSADKREIGLSPFFISLGNRFDK